MEINQMILRNANFYVPTHTHPNCVDAGTTMYIGIILCYVLHGKKFN